MNPIRVFVADDHPVYRDGLAKNWRDYPRIDVIGTAGDGSTAIEGIRTLQPDVVILDLKLPIVDGMVVLKTLLEEGTTARFLILTAYMDSATVYDAFAAGAKGFLEKAASLTEVTQAVLTVGEGATVMAAFAQEVLASELRNRQHQQTNPSLTPRELETLKLVADGHSAQRIALLLHISLATVKSHLQHVYEKLGVSDRASAVAQAIRRGLLR